jgi:HK97 family phage prohead protease
MSVLNKAPLYRTSGFTARAADGAADGLTLAGYAAVFGSPTRINSWEGTFDESIRAGAFRKTLKESTPVMQFDHGRHATIGSIPIGRYTDLTEDDHGLAVEGRLSDNWLVQPVRDAVASGAISGMSFRFESVREEWRTADGKVINPAADPDLFFRILYMGEEHEAGPLQRELIEVKMPEAGPVVFPAYRDTSVSVRAAEVADQVRVDGRLLSEVRSGLMAPAGVTVDLPVDPELRRDIARALLFGAVPERITSTTSTTGPVAPVQQDRLRALIQATDAPPTGHPTDGPAPSDAPPPKAPAAATPARSDAPAVSHPSLTPQQARIQRTRMDYVTRERVGKA